MARKTEKVENLEMSTLDTSSVDNANSIVLSVL